MKTFIFINTEGFVFRYTAKMLKDRDITLVFERAGEWAVFSKGQYRGQLYKKA